MPVDVEQLSQPTRQTVLPGTTTPVAYLMSRFPKLTETFILREILELERQGQPVIVFPLLREQQPVRHAEVDQVIAKVHYTPFLSFTILSAHLYYLRRSPRRYLRTWWLALRGTWGSANLFIGALVYFPKAVFLARRIEQEGIRHVHAHFATHPALAAWIISELTGVSFSFTAHAHDIFVTTHMLCEKLAKARFVIAVSEFNKQYLLRLAPETPADKVHVIHCGIEPGYYQRPRLQKPDQPFTIVCVASLQPHKGLEYLIRACTFVSESIQGFRCLIVGDGPQRCRLERLIATLGLQDVVTLLGPQPQERVAQLLAQTDLFVLPSVIAVNGQMEGLPVALMEAMASGVPVIATRLSGVPELVQDGVTGLLVPPADAEAIAQAIVRCAHDASLRQALAHAGRAHVAERFELTTNVDALRSLLSNATRGALDVAGAWDVGKQARVLEVVQTDAYQHGRTQPLTVRLGPRVGGQDSEVYPLWLRHEDGTSSRLIWKLHRPAWAAPEERWARGAHHARREYETLANLWNAFARHSGRFTVPRPLGFFPEWGALLLEHCSGERLVGELGWARVRAIGPWKTKLFEQMRAAGEWLGVFHQITATDGEVQTVVRLIEEEFQRDLDRCGQRGLDRELVSRLAQAFAACKEMLKGRTQLIVNQHGDFGPHNVFLSGRTVTVIDFEGLRPGFRYSDLSYFLAMAESMPGFHVGPALIREMTERFLNGYTRYHPVDRKLLRAFMVPAMVKLMAYNPLLARSPRNPLERWRQAARRQRYVVWLRRHV